MVAAIAAGLLGFFVNLWPIETRIAGHPVSLQLGLWLPLVIAMAWGWRYALVAAFSGLGAQAGWLLWPENGWGNITGSLSFAGWLAWHGYLAAAHRRRPSRWNDPYVGELLFRVVDSAYRYVIHPYFVALGSPPWSPGHGGEPIPIEALHVINMQLVFNGLLMVLVADLVSSVSWVRRRLGLAPRSGDAEVSDVVGRTLAGALVVWLAMGLIEWLGLGADPRAAFEIIIWRPSPQNSLARFTVLAVCLAAGVGMTRYLRRTLVAERARLRDELRLRTLVETISEWIWEIDASGTFTYASPRAREVVGRTPEELVGTSSLALMEDPFRCAIASGQPFLDCVHTVVAHDGERKILETSATPSLDAEGRAQAWRGSSRDVTGRLALETELRQSQKMDSLGRLAGGVAHDFNNMLQSIITTTELLQRTHDDPEARQRYTADITKLAEQAADLTTKLLAFSRKNTLRPTPIDLHELLADVVKLLARGCDPGIEVRLEPRAARSIVLGDRSALSSVFSNLGLNARDALPGGGEILLRTSELELDGDARPPGTPRELGPGTYLRVDVRDDGVGMEPAVLAKAMDPFFTTKELGRGTGLGLAMVHGVVREHGGDVSLASEPGAGTTVSLWLPAGESTSEPVADRPAQSTEGNGAVLLADDDDDIRAYMRTALERQGYEVLAASDGAAALAVFEACHDRVRVAILDVTMPKLRGDACAARMRALNPDLKVILMSGYDELAAHDGRPELANVGFLHKPFRLKELLRELDRLS